MKTIQELREQRTSVLDQLDDIVRTSQEAGTWTDEDRARYDALTAEDDSLLVAIRTAEVDEADNGRVSAHEARRSAFSVPNINVRGGSAVGADVTRSLDSLLWATNDSVAAGSYDKTGQFRQHSVARNQVEQVVVRNADGGAEYAPRLAEFQPEHRAVIRSFQDTVANMALFGMLIDKDAKSSARGFEAARSHKAFANRWRDICRALDVDTSGEGADWVPTGIGASMHEKVRAAGKVAALFARIDLPTNPWKWPIEGSDATAYRVGEPTGDTATKVTVSTPGTAAATFDAEIVGGRILFSRSLDADSALAILPFTTRKLVQAFVDAEETAIINGDSDGTHQDSDIGSSTTAAQTLWDGLRKRALANASTATTTSTAANLGAIRALMGKWGVNPSSLAFIVGVSAYHDLILDSNVLTVDKLGPNATILNGQLASVYGIPLIVSEHVRENVNASGVYDGITTTKTYNLCVNRDEWVMGQRMALDVEVDDSIYRETFQRVAVGFMREDFQNVGDASSNDDTAIGYNVTP